MFSTKHRDPAKEKKAFITRISKVNLPEKNGASVVINNDITPLHIINKIKANEIIKEIIVSTYFINKDVISYLQKICPSFELIAANNLLLANRSRGEWIEQNTDIALTDIHAKIGLVKTDKNNYVISGSGNYASLYRPRLEWLTIINNDEIFEKTKNHYKKLKNGSTKRK